MAPFFPQTGAAMVLIQALGAVAAPVENLFGIGCLAAADGAFDGILVGLEAAPIGMEQIRPAIGVDTLADGDGAAKDGLRAGIAHKDAAAGRVCDEDAYGDGVEDGPEKGLAFAESLFSFFAVVDIFESAIPADDIAGGIPARGRVGTHPAPDPIAAADTKFDIEGTSAPQGIVP